MDFIDEALIPCHGIRESRIGHALSEKYIMILNDDMMKTSAIVWAKLTVSLIYYYLLAFFKHVK